jgi:hypothetical protein
MKLIAACKQSALVAALLVAAMITTSAQAIPVSAKVMAGFKPDALVTVGTLDFQIAEGDGSVRPFDYLKALGDGSVRKSGDGSVRSCDGSVMPAAGACESPLVDLGSFAFGGSVDVDPAVSFVMSVTNLSANPLSFALQITSPFLGGPYDSLATALTGSGEADSIVMDTLIDASVVAAASITCATPAACSDPLVTLSPPTNASGVLSLLFSFTVQPGRNASAAFSGSAVLAAAPPPGVPEPTSLALFGLGLFGTAVARQQRRV